MKVIAFVSDKGGMGKSTAAINLACAAMEDGIETAILDLDPQASVGRWSRTRKKIGGKSGPFAEVCVPIDVEDRLQELKSVGAQVVILDTAGRDNNAITAAIAAADLVLVPCHPTDLELATLGPTIRRLKADDKPHFVLLIDWNVGAVRRRIEATAAIERSGGRVAPAIYTHRADYRLAVEQGLGVTEFEPWQSASSEIRKVWKWLKAEAGVVPARQDALV